VSCLGAIGILWGNAYKTQDKETGASTEEKYTFITWLRLAFLI
jgi:hypothetical protein